MNITVLKGRILGRLHVLDYLACPVCMPSWLGLYFADVSFAIVLFFFFFCVLQNDVKFYIFFVHPELLRM